MRFLELLLVTMLTSLILSSGLWLIDKIRSQNIISDEEVYVMALVVITMIMVIYNLFYNILLSNLRFAVKMRCVTFGLCIFDCTNHICCWKCCKTLCENKFTNKNICFTILKWGVTAIFCSITIIFIKNERSNWEEDFVIGMQDRWTTRYDSYMILYLLHIPVFFLARIPIFFIFSIFASCCLNGEPEINECELKEHVVSHEFIEYELGILHNFQHHPVGR